MKEDLEFIMRSGAICGLKTISEAILNFELHGIQLFPHNEIKNKLENIYNQYEEWLRAGNSDDIPEYILEETMKEINEFFKEELKCEKSE